MKVIKRDGHMVDYCPEKIEIAIKKANEEVQEEDRVSDTQIKNIIKYIESLKKRRILVEDIQDIIEMRLMALNKFALAKEYITSKYSLSSSPTRYSFIASTVKSISCLS